jgi:hypothetical protein
LPFTLTRSILVVILPGLVASAPWVLLAAKEWPELSQLYREFPTPANAVLLALIVVLGTTFEGLGSFLEDRWDDELEDECQVDRNWYRYLARVCEHEPVGFHYLSSFVTSLYFELSMMFASLILFIGLAALCLVSGIWAARWFSLLLALVGLGVSYYYRWQARTSHRVLCETRQALNREMDRDVERGVAADEAR